MHEMVHSPPSWHVMMSQMPIPVICLDTDLLVLQWNGFAEGLFGWSEAETVGRSIIHLLPQLVPDVPPGGLTVFEFAMAYGCWKGEVEQRHKNGTTLRVQISVAPLLDQNGRFFLWLITAQNQTDWHSLDTTMRQAYLELETDMSGRSRQFEAQKRQLKAHISHLEILHQLDRAILSATTLRDIADRTLKTLHTLCYWWNVVSLIQIDDGTATATLLGQHPLHMIAPRAARPFSIRSCEALLAQLANGKPCFLDNERDMETHATYLKRLQLYRYKMVIIVPLVANDQLVATLNIASDTPRAVTPQMEKLFRDIGGVLANALLRVRHTDKLREKVDALQAQNSELTEFAHYAAHDMREPLRMVDAYLTLLVRRFGDELPSEVLEFVTFAQQGAKRMKTLIDDLLSYSRLDRLNSRRQQVDCSEALEIALANLSVALEEHDATVVYGTLPTLSGYPTQIVRLFQNLLSNALKFRSHRSPNVKISCVSKGMQWEFRLEDNGIGIEPAHQREIFDIFRRLHGYDQYPGSGIGLAICKKIVEQHNGRIWFTSTPSQGTTFFFTIPQK